MLFNIYIGVVINTSFKSSHLNKLYSFKIT